MDENQSENKKKKRDTSYGPKKSYHLIERKDHKRPIYGVLTEPIRGDMQKDLEADFAQKEQKPDDMTINHRGQVSYIPKAHVQFLEQSGIRVVPIHYQDKKEDIKELLDQVNGIYIPGDSHKSLSSNQYIDTIQVVLDYVQDRYDKDSDYFPMFCMGKCP